MRNIVLLFLISFFISENISAQIRGTAVDSATRKPLGKAVVGLFFESIKKDTVHTLTNENGEFRFDTIVNTNFFITISSVGYRTITRFRRIHDEEKWIDLDSIPLISESLILEEVKIIVPAITIKEDTIEYRADAFKVKENAVVEDLLKKLPGVQVDRDGNIKAQGKDVTRIKVNGKDFFSGDPLLATRELPANIVDKVQIINDYGDQAAISGIKQGEPEKTLNIRVKKDKNRGSFGRASAGIGNEKRYAAAVNCNYFNNQQQISLFGASNNINPSFTIGANRVGRFAASFDNIGGLMGSGNVRSSGGSIGSDGIITTNSAGINYRDNWGKKITVYGSYAFSRRNTSGKRITAQQNIFPTETFFNDQTNNFKNLGDNHSLFFNIECNIDSFNFLKISPTFSRSNNDGYSNTLFDYFTTSVKTSEGYYNTISTSNSPALSGIILYNHRFRKKGRNFSLNINASTTENNSYQDSRNHTVQYDPATTTDFFLFNYFQNDNDNYGIRLTYTEPLTNTRFLDATFAHDFSYSKSNRIVYNVDPATEIKMFSQGLSDNYKNDYVNDQLRISLRTIQKKYNYAVGISAEPVNLRGSSITRDSSYKPVKAVNIFPVANFGYNFSNTRSISFNYRGSAQQPGFRQLQDVIDSSNVQYQTRGNPNLKPSINHNLSAYYNSFNPKTGKVLFTNISFNITKNQIVYNNSRIGASGAQLTTPENVSGYYNVTASYDFSQPFNNRRNLARLNGSLNYNHNINLFDKVKNSANNWLIGQGINFNLNYKDWLECNAGINYSLNSIRYGNAGINNGFQNAKFSTWNFSSSAALEIGKGIVFRYDLYYLINSGLTGNVGKNVANLNASVEKQFLNNDALIRLQGFDLLNQNTTISRSIYANSVIDSRSTRLNRYFLLSFVHRIKKFKK